MKINRLTTAALLLAGLLSAASSFEPAGASAEAGCEGDACPQVTLAFDEAKQRYRARNNSPDRWVRLSASNLAAAAEACLPPGRDSYLPLKSVVTPYRAEYAAVKCGEQDEGR